MTTHEVDSSLAAGSPPVLPVTDAERARPLSQRLFREATPWLVSLWVNLTFMVVLGLLAMPLLVKGGAHEISMLSSLSDEADPMEALDVAVNLEPSSVVSAASSDRPTSVDPEFGIRRDESAQEFLPITAALVPEWERKSSLPTWQHLDMPTNIGEPPKPLTAKELTRATSVEEAVDGIGAQIRERLAEKDLLVVWLLDASLSLVDDRQRVATRLDAFYNDLEREYKEALSRSNRKKNQPVLTNAVVAYGGGFAELVGPTAYVANSVFRAIRNIPVDRTGLENVMAAVNQCAVTYPSTLNRQTIIVIWTDESGDDIGLLEPTIEICRRTNVRVSIVGPTAVLGAQEGTHVWIHESGQEFYLPVLKGPDTALPERLRWPYWWQTELPAWHPASIQTRNEFQGWYGGDQMASLSSGFPPYALTRLARETGGTMTIFDREIDRGPFTPEKMSSYAPDYRSAREILEELRYCPLRLALLKSVDLTRSLGSIPSTPYGFTFVPAPRMRRLLADNEKRLIEPIQTLEQAMTPLSNKDIIESLYESERSTRWQAWYDLTYGRLLAQSVRYAEAQALFLQLAKPGSIPKDANCLSFSPTSRLISGYQAEERARDAERLLSRCIAKNPHTPWAYLAQRELDHPFGLTYQASYVKPPKPSTESSPRPDPIKLPRL